MKDKKSMIIVCLVILIIKIIGGIFTNSYTLASSAILECILLTYFLLSNKKENKKGYGILTSFIGLLFIIISIGLLFISIIKEPTKPSYFIILFIIICILAKYAVTSFRINTTYNRKSGLLATNNINSNLEFYIYGVVLGSLILCKLSHFFKILRYGDKLGTFLITGVAIYYGLRLIVHSIKFMEDKEVIISESYKEQITARNEIKRLDSININNFGGLITSQATIELKEGISLVDINTFAVTLEDYLLKISDVTEVRLISSNNKKNKPKVVSKKAEAIKNAKAKKKGNSSTSTKPYQEKEKNKETKKEEPKVTKPKSQTKQNKKTNSKGSKKNAGNSRSGNSKKNTKRKNSSQKNKKR